LFHCIFHSAFVTMTAAKPSKQDLQTIASKAIRKSDDGKLKIKKLIKKVLKKTGADEGVISPEFFHSNDLFEVCSKGVYVSLAQVSDDGEKTDVKRKREDKSLTESKAKKKKKNVEDKSGDIDSWRKDNKVAIEGTKDKDASYLKPLRSFDDEHISNLNSKLLKYCTETKGFSKPSPIQAQCWPILASDKHVVGIAETGSGKTLAFAVPALSAMRSKKYVQMLVLAPTRELAMQSHNVLEEFGKIIGLGSMVIYGGVSKAEQISRLNKDCPQCIVATPGRLVDLLNQKCCDLSKVHYLVLDEADRMLDMGKN